MLTCLGSLGIFFRGHDKALVALFRFLLLISPTKPALITKELVMLQTQLQRLLYKYITHTQQVSYYTIVFIVIIILQGSTRETSQQQSYTILGYINKIHQCSKLFIDTYNHGI